MSGRPAGPAYAGFWRRLGAAVLDAFLFATLAAPLLLLVYGPAYFGWLRQAGDLFSVYGVFDLLLTRIAPLAAIIVCWTLWGATPGKLLMNCEVLDSASGRRPGLRQAVVRCAAYLASALPLYLGFLWIVWDRRKQGFHDKIAGTVVVHRAADYARMPLSELAERVR